MSGRVGDPWKTSREHRAALDERLDDRLAAGRKPRRRIVIARWDGEEITATDLGRAVLGMLFVYLALVIFILAGTALGFGG